MKRIIAVCLCACLCLTGCANMFDGHYVNVTPHEEQNNAADTQAVSAADYDQLCNALQTMTRSGAESGVISVAQYDQSDVDGDMKRAIGETLAHDPITAYAVEQIQYELGASAGQPAIAVQISYVHDRTQIQKIRKVVDLQDAKDQIALELNKCSTGVVLYVDNYEPADLVQWVEDYAALYPESVMETPETMVNVYPESGDARVIELKFTYQNSRDSLRTMQSQVSPMFASAVLYVSGDGASREKYSQLYAFLMERFENYTLDTSITPAYSLLIHGVGDAEAFATVYSAMCRQAELECVTVGGTRNGQAWYWNIVRDGDVYYHVDLLQCNANGAFREQTDEEMSGYVWDYSAYPACGVAAEPEATE